MKNKEVFETIGLIFVVMLSPMTAALVDVFLSVSRRG